MPAIADHDGLATFDLRYAEWKGTSWWICDVDCTPVVCGDLLTNASAGEEGDTGGEGFLVIPTAQHRCVATAR